METLQVEPFPADLWLRVLHAANLTPKQRQTIIETYEKFSQGTAQLLQQQHTLMQELQATMGVGAIQHSSAAAGAAAVSANVRPAGAAHFMSLATGGPVPLSEADATASAAAGAHAGANGSQHACAAPDAVMRSPLRWDNTGTPLSPDEMQFLTEWLSDCKEQSSSALEASRNSNSWLAPAGVLPLVSAEKADALMQQLSRIAGGVKQHLHQLTIMVSWFGQQQIGHQPGCCMTAGTRADGCSYGMVKLQGDGRGIRICLHVARVLEVCLKLQHEVLQVGMHTPRRPAASKGTAGLWHGDVPKDASVLWLLPLLWCACSL